MRNRIVHPGIAALIFLMSDQPLRAEDPPRIGGVNLQDVLTRTQEGEKRRAEIEAKYKAVEEDLRSRQREIDGIRERLRQGEQTLNDAARAALLTEIDRKTRALDRAVEDAQEDFEENQQRIIREMGPRLLDLVREYASRNGYSLILDSSSPSASVLLVASQADIAAEIIREYDRKYPAAGPASTPTGS